LDVPKAVHAWQRQHKRRTQWKLDDIVAHPPKELIALYGKLVPRTFHKFTRLGHPILIQRLGDIDFDAMEASSCGADSNGDANTGSSDPDLGPAFESHPLGLVRRALLVAAG
jgi:hypothetical protein